MIGKTILHYKILSKLGEGGMGVVYKAEDTKIKREVAIKFLPRQIAASDEERERFKIEAQAAGALNHSNIATIHAIEEADDETFIVMEHLKGQELKDKIDAGPLPIDDTLNIAIQIAKGLKAAHNKDIIHRDIKSANIMLTDEGDVKIMDFGLAKRDGQAKLTEEGTTHGTVAYMSPEQTQGDEVDRRSDIFSLGVLLYEMLTGQLPFKGDYYQAITYSVLNEEPEPVTGIRTGIPMEVERIVNKCLRKDAAFRYQSADELIVDLRVQQGESSTVSQPAMPIGSIAEAPPAIAVLPFENRSPDEENEFLSDGIAEDIITALSKLGGLRVAARNAVFQFKGQTPDIRKVGGQLNVETVLAGSVRQAGNRLRIHVQLSNVADGYEIWSERYDRVMADVFDIQDEISQAVVETLKVKLIGAQKIPIFKHYTENAEAYSLYLRGRFYWNKRMPDTIAKAKKNYEDALAKDPEYALAHSGLADCYTALVLSNEVAPPSEVMSKAKMSALKALEIDANLAEAHASLAFVNVLYDWDWSGAERALERALNLNPDYASAYHWQAIFLFPGTGRLSEAEAAARRAQELDPISPSISIDLACVHLFMGQYEKVVQEASNALELDLKNPYAHFFLGRALVLQGSYDEGRQALKKAKLLTFQEGHIGYAHAVSGNRNAAQKSLAALNRKSRPIHITAYQQALIYCGLGDLDQAFQSLNLACENRSPQLVWTRFAPEFEPLHRDLRWEELLRKVGVFGTPESDLE